MKSKLLIFAVAALITSLFFIDFCALVYQCGCRSLWAGAANHCNIHDAMSRHCPWCSVGDTGAFAIYAAILGVQALAAFKTNPPTRRAILTLAAFPLTGGVLALTLGLALGYWK